MSVLKLLEVQKYDIRIANEESRRKSLPERDAHQQVSQKLSQAETLIGKIKERLEELAESQKLSDQEAADAESIRAESESRLYSGEVTGMRAVTALQDQIAAQKRRKQTAEEIALDVMTQLEEMHSKLNIVEEKHKELSTECETRLEQLNAMEAQLDESVTELKSQREALVTGISTEVLAQYEERRDQLGGVGIAALIENHCQGCELNLLYPVSELEKLKKAPRDSLQDCFECGRFIVYMNPENKT